MSLARKRHTWNFSDVQKHGGPNYATVKAIEEGRIGQLDKLQKHAQALGLSLVTLFRSITSDERPLSPEAAKIVEKYGTTTLRGRQALVAIAQALPEEGHEPTTGSLSDMPAIEQDRKPAARPTQKRRG